MATKPKPTPVFAIVVERTVRLQHILMLTAPDVDSAIEQAEELVTGMSDTAFSWREDSMDAWSAFGSRDTGSGEQG